MAGTVTMGGLGSGMDVEGLISGLVKANQVTMSRLTSRASTLRSASSTLSDIGTALANLQSAADGLSSTQGVGSMSAASSSTAVVASASGAAQPASYQIKVTSLAAEQRTYSKSFASGALGQTGSFSIKVGSGTAKSIAVTATDTLDGIASKINQAGLRVSASVFYDGSKYRLQLRGLDTGESNALTFVENGTALDLNGDGSDPAGGKTVQNASDAKLSIDDFEITRSTNQITGSIPGVTLALTAKTTDPISVTVSSDPAALTTKVTSFINAFNSVNRAIHTAAGYGSQKASNSQLSADSALRTISDRLTKAVTTSSKSGPYQTLADIGIKLDRNGALQLDSAKLSAAMSKDAASVVNLLARPAGATTGGVMAGVKDIAATMGATGTGIIAVRKEMFEKQAKELDKRANSEQNRLDTYAENLRRQFTEMDAKMGSNQVLMSAVSAMFR